MDTRRENTPTRARLASVRARRNRSPTAVGRRGELKTFCGPPEGQVFGPSTKFAANGALLGDRSACCAAASVRRVSADADALPDWRHEKDLQTQAFSRAADGIRTHDLLHGKQNPRRRCWPIRPCKSALFLRRAHRDDPRISPRDHGGLGTESGLSGVPAGKHSRRRVRRALLRSDPAPVVTDHGPAAARVRVRK
jgi:hypothetical protein